MLQLRSKCCTNLTFAATTHYAVPSVVRCIPRPPFFRVEVAMHKNLKPALALSVLHRDERDVCANLVRNVTKAIYKDNSNGRGNPTLVDSGTIVKTVRKLLRACVFGVVVLFVELPSRRSSNLCRLGTHA